MIVLIAAMSEARVIGNQNKLPWNIKEELEHFRTTTKGHTVLMGRNTYESIGRLLPNRHNVIITSRPLELFNQEATVTSDLEGFLTEWQDKDETLFVIGGAQVYAFALPFANEIILSTVYGSFKGDVYFPTIPQTFKLFRTEEHELFKVEYYKKNL